MLMNNVNKSPKLYPKKLSSYKKRDISNITRYGFTYEVLLLPASTWMNSHHAEEKLQRKLPLQQDLSPQPGHVQFSWFNEDSKDIINKKYFHRFFRKTNSSPLPSSPGQRALCIGSRRQSDYAELERKSWWCRRSRETCVALNIEIFKLSIR